MEEVEAVSAEDTKVEVDSNPEEDSAADMEVIKDSPVDDRSRRICTLDSAVRERVDQVGSVDTEVDLVEEVDLAVEDVGDSQVDLIRLIWALIRVSLSLLRLRSSSRMSVFPFLVLFIYGC